MVGGHQAKTLMLRPVPVVYVLGGVEWYTTFLQSLFADYMRPVLEYMRQSKHYTPVSSAAGFVRKAQHHFHGILERQISDVVRTYSNDVRRFTRYRPVDTITKLHMACYMLPHEKLIPTREMLNPDVPPTGSHKIEIKVSEQGRYVPPAAKPRSRKEARKRELDKLNAVEQTALLSGQHPKLYNIGDYVEGRAGSGCFGYM